MKDKSITHNIFIIKDDDSIMYGFYCITFTKYMVIGKTLLDYAILFLRNDFSKNDKIICKFLKTNMAGLDFRLNK